MENVILLKNLGHLGSDKSKRNALFYEILGVGKNASFKDIHAAYQKLLCRWHPDKVPCNEINEYL